MILNFKKDFRIYIKLLVIIALNAFTWRYAECKGKSIVVLLRTHVYKKKDTLYLKNALGEKFGFKLRNRTYILYSNTRISRGLYSVPGIGQIYLNGKGELEIINSRKYKGSAAFENSIVSQVNRKIDSLFPLNTDGLFFQNTYLSEPEDFLRNISSLESASSTIIRTSKDSTFKKVFGDDIKYRLKGYKIKYFGLYGTDLNKMTSYSDSIANLDKNDPKYFIKFFTFQNASKLKIMNSKNQKYFINLMNEYFYKDDSLLIINSNSYIKEIERYIQFLYFRGASILMNQKRYTDENDAKFSIVQDSIKNKYVRSLLLYRIVDDVFNSTIDSFLIKGYYTRFQNSKPCAFYGLLINDKYQKWLATNREKSLPSFEFKSQTGKLYSNKALEGSYKLIDIWATWCVPCKHEIPYLEKLVADYKNQNLLFVSISVDSKDRIQTWNDFVVSNNLPGIQLITDNGFDSDFIKKMGITSIPRYILTDRRNNIIARSAFRPSDPRLKLQIDSILNIVH